MLLRSAVRLMLLGAFVGWSAPGRVDAGMIFYDESTGGDLGGQPPGTDFGTLAAGDGLSVAGSLDAGLANDGPDTFDDFSFTTLGAWDFRVSSVTLGSNPAGLMVFLFRESGGVLSFVNALTYSGLGAAPAASLFGPLDAGTYVASLAPEANSGSLSYVVGVGVEGGSVVAAAAVPEPASLVLCGLAAPGCLALARSRRRRAA